MNRLHRTTSLNLAASTVAILGGGVVAALVSLTIVSGAGQRRYVLVGVGLAIAAVIAVRLARAAHTFPGFALSVLAAVLILVPVDYLPALHKEAVSLSIDPILLLAVLGLAGTPFAISRRRIWPLVLSATVLALGALVYLGNSNTNARYYFLSFIVVGCVVFVAGWRGSRSPEDLRLLSRVIMGSGFVAAGVGVLEFVSKHNPVYSHYLPGQSTLTGAPTHPFSGVLSQLAPRSQTSGYRITSTIGHPLDVAALLSVTVLVSIGVGLETNKLPERSIAFAIGGLAFVAMIMTRSRAVLVLAPIAVLLLVIAANRRRRFTRTTILITLGLAAGIWLTRGIWVSRFVSRSGTSSTQARVLGLSYTESLLPDTIPLGLGFGAAQARVGARGQTIGSATSEVGWGELMIDGGPLFAIALLAIPLGGGISALRGRRRDEPLRLAYGVAAVFLTVDGFSFNAVAVSPRSYLFATMLVAGAAVSDRAVAPTQELRPAAATRTVI